MNAVALNKDIYNKALELGIEKITLRFFGGSDEGFLDVDVEPWNNGRPTECNNLSAEIEDWAWSVYPYSGAGDGSDFGDDITYDLVNKRVSTSEWYTVRQIGDNSETDLEFDED